MSFRFLLVSILLIVGGPFVSAETKHKISESDVIGTLDMAIFYSSQVKTVGEWIDKNAPDDEKSERRKILKPILNEPMPGMIRAGHDLMFYDPAAKKLQTLTVIRYGSADFYFYEGKDVTRYPKQSFKEWASENFGMKVSSASLIDYVVPQADASFLGSNIGAVVAMTTYDAAMKNFPAPAVMSDVNPDELHRIAKEMTGKDIPTLPEAQAQIEMMKVSVLTAIEDGNHVQCVDKHGEKYSGAKFTMNINGRDFNIVSQPQSSLTSLKMSLQSDKKNKSEILYDQATNGFRIQAESDGRHKIFTGKQREDTGDDDDVLGHLVSPWVKDDRVKRRDETFSSSETHKIVEWLNKEGADVGRGLRVCNAFLARPSRYPMKDTLTGANATFAEITQRRQFLGSRVERKILDIKGTDIAAACAAFKDASSTSEKLTPKIDSTTLYLARSAFRCDKIAELVKDPIEAKDLTSAPGGRLTSACRRQLLGAMMADKSMRETGERVRNAVDFNKSAKQIEDQYSERVNDYYTAVDLGESATACCRTEPCRKEMMAAKVGEKKMSEKSGIVHEE
jgi:hypothetical protein